MLTKIWVLRKAFKKTNILEFIFYLGQIFLIKAGLTTRLYLLPSKYSLILRKGSTDIPVFREIFLEKEYDLDLPHPVKFIIDGGANVGVSTLFFKIRYPEARIIAVEPEKENYKLLKKNSADFDGITCLKAGIWHKSANLSIVSSENFGEWGFQLKEMSERTSSGSAGVKCYSIDELLEKFSFPRIDILKLDIEGAEKMIFSSRSPQAWLTKCRTIIIELHDFIDPQISQSFFEYLDTFVQYDCFISGENTVVIIKGENENICN